MRKEIFKMFLYPDCHRAFAAISFQRVFKWFVIAFFIALAGSLFCTWFPVPARGDPPEKFIEGTVIDEKEAVSGAVVRIQTTQHGAVSDIRGKFTLPVPNNITGPVKLTTWAKGYFIHGPVEALPGENGVTISLHRHGKWDNPEYEWLPSISLKDSGDNQVCAECHFRGESGSGPLLPVDEWLLDAHSQSAANPIFLTLYYGIDVSGRRSQSTRYRYNPDNTLHKLPPDPQEPWYGPGYRLDNPNTPGNCGACHLAAAAVNAPVSTDPAYIQGVGTEGINCDFCHKIWDVRLDSATGLPSPDKPGVLSYEFRRPFNGYQLFVGPLDDIAPGEDTYSGLQKQSQFCAPCHFGVFGDTVVYDSFGEWLRSPYSDEKTGKTCQDCHMPGSGAEYFAHPEKGGLKRDPDTLAGHRMPGARDLDLLQNSVSLTIEAENTFEGLRVRTEVINDQTGHHVPTDTPLRHVILVVRAYASNTAELSLKKGPVLPEWCGAGNPKHGCYAGLPGKVYVKLLEEEWSGDLPTAAYWNPTRVVMDTRIGAFESDADEFLFDAPASGEARVMAQLVYRRVYREIMDLKGLNEPDIIMETAELSVSLKN